jgi:hypothetical protein
MAMGHTEGSDGLQGVGGSETGRSGLDQDEIQCDATAESEGEGEGNGNGNGSGNGADRVEGGSGVEGKGEGKGKKQTSLAPERKWDGRLRVFVEGFPNQSAGAPISNKLKDGPDLNVYMRDCGPLGDRDIFEAAEVLMTTGLTDEGKDRHIKTKLVSEVFNSCHTKLTDLTVSRASTLGQR